MKTAFTLLLCILEAVCCAAILLIPALFGLAYDILPILAGLAFAWGIAKLTSPNETPAVDFSGHSDHTDDPTWRDAA